MSAVAVTSYQPHFAAAVRGADLREPVAPAQFAEIEAAFNRYSVLVFPGQALTDAQQIAFSEQFGPQEPLANYTGVKKLRLEGPISDLSNLDPQGNIWSEESERRLFNRGNLMWHTDSSFKHVPALASMLSAREIPPVGGETEFCDLRAAYDALPQATRDRIDGLVVEHNIFYSRSLLGVKKFDPGAMKAMPPVQQRLVRRHPGSGRKTLYLASHASHVIGRPVEEGRKLIEELMEFATQRRFVYQHHWSVHDLVMWDNRCTMHRGLPYDDLKYRRDMHRTTVADRANTLEMSDA
jgi:alpha-ketoglutarate-dependent 2,4-dichlorophenoxyacetate dioxygenase